MNVGPNKHTLTQLKDAVRDGLRAVKNVIDDGPQKIIKIIIIIFSLLGAVLPGAGAVEVAMHSSLMEFKKTVAGRARLGVEV